MYETNELSVESIVVKLKQQNRFRDGKLNCEVICLDNAEKVCKYSFIVHKSINHLDLSLREFSSLREKSKVWVPLLFCSADPAFSKKFVCTAEGCRKTMKLQRRWLYTLHLDLPASRENYSVTSAPDSRNFHKQKTFCFNEMIVCDSVYKDSLRNFIDEALTKKGMEMNVVRSHMALMRRILDKKWFELRSLEARILKFLFSSCTDTNIVLEFLPLLDFNSWIHMESNLKIVEYVLHHACLGRYDLKLNDRQGALLNQCFVSSRFKQVQLLLKYQNAPYYYENSSGILSTWIRDSPISEWPYTDMQKPLRKGLISRRRYSLWLQIFNAYSVNDQPPWNHKSGPTLRLLWRSLPDAYFTLEELLRIYEGVRAQHRIIRKVYKFYARSIGKDMISGMPRPLKHFCRTTIRKSLCYNLKLPHGLEELSLPPLLKTYIRLEEVV